QGSERGRTVRRVHRGRRDDVGDLVTRRPVPNEQIEQVDPFLFLNHHGPQVYPPGNGGLPFGPHPHRGFETVTFVVEGSLLHRDTAGHESAISGGGVQWMTAGSGIEHAEVSPDEFREQGGPLELLQLWVNLPARLKWTGPRYAGLQENEIPAIAEDEGRVTIHLIAGSWNGVRGPIESLTGVQMTTVELKAGGSVSLPAPRGRSVFLYVVRGEADVAGRRVGPFHLVELNDDGDSVAVQSITGALLLFGHADPIGEPVVAHGPFVMNTRQEIVEAIRDYQMGKFAGKVALD
ncbi:MAG: yhhW 3, partial [Acidobacteria bacterium]|nr:yhhW 3 [Acidobacteriota bacterium]